MFFWRKIFSLVWFSTLFYHHLLRAHQTSWHNVWWFYFSLHYKCKQTDRFSVDTINSNRASLEVSLWLNLLSHTFDTPPPLPILGDFWCCQLAPKCCWKLRRFLSCHRFHLFQLRADFAHFLNPLTVPTNWQ